MKNILSGLLVAFLSVSIFVTVFLIKRHQETILRAMPSTLLFIDSDFQQIKTGEEFEMRVKTSTGGNRIVSGDIVINFDPQAVEIIDVLNVDFLHNINTIEKVIDNQNGKIIYSYYVAPENARSGQGSLLLVKAKGKKEEVTSISFDDKSAMYGAEETENVITSATSKTFTISNTTSLKSTTPISITGEGESGSSGDFVDRKEKNLFSDITWISSLGPYMGAGMVFVLGIIFMIIKKIMGRKKDTDAAVPLTGQELAQSRVGQATGAESVGVALNSLTNESKNETLSTNTPVAESMENIQAENSVGSNPLSPQQENIVNPVNSSSIENKDTGSFPDQGNNS